MRRIRWASGLSIALSVALALSAPGAARFHSSVSITFFPSAYGEAMSGKVGSSMAACKSGRTLTLYRAGKGGTTRYAGTHSGASGKWLIFPHGSASFPPGHYFVRLKAKPLAGQGACAGARSPRVSVG